MSRTAAVVVISLAWGVFLAGSSAVAGVHLSDSSCTECHGTNVRSIHDAEDTVRADCDICHARGGVEWPLNETVYDMFDAYYGEFNPLLPVAEGYVLPEDFGFEFACKSCHVGRNSGHQAK